MNRRHAILLTTAMMLGCCGDCEVELEQLDHVILFDVQGLWGGQDIWISRDAKAVCRLVVPPKQGESGLQETRYNFALSAQQQATLLQLMEKHRLYSLKTTERNGLPDEARPIITIRSGARSYSIAKWANDKHNDFDPIYQFLLQIIESGKKGKEVYSGPLDRDWRPDGFPENKSIWKAISPESIKK